MSSTLNTRLIWIDLEMTGLDTDNDQIIEIATIITDDHLNVLAEGPVLAIHQPDRILNAMDEWNTRQHGQSGLIERVRRSKLTARDAELQTLEFLKNGLIQKFHQCVVTRFVRIAVSCIVLCLS